MIERLQEQARRLSPLADPALALIVLLVSLQAFIQPDDCVGCEPWPWWGYAIVLGECLPLVVRRRWPFQVVFITGILTAIYGLSDLPDPQIEYAGLVALYSCAAHASRKQSNIAAVIAAVVIVGSLAADPRADTEDYTVTLLIFTTAWLLGDAARRRREIAAVLTQRTEQLERTRSAESAAAVSAERNRIAREMHDVVAHHLSMMVVQAEAGAATAQRDPARAEQVFDAIGGAGKQALREMRRLLGVLKQDGPAELAPQPSAAEIPSLVDGVRSAGLDVDLQVEGEAPSLAPAADLAVYRVVQESLTNCIRHAHASRAVVVVRYDAGAVRITVSDNGTGGSVSPGGGGGHGLISMRERVGLVGGTIEAGPAEGGGWQVHAVVPTDS
ncbi:sensor histidine kinase [Luteipulveratus mongoliensis]|uniref:histidine kinase n=1 Tax=Luteipulveratus mongoliensis TaxID=571913 RepID=A0A0K1JFT9_9MICO|nr:histidine kinase [Luteipulveratus mongoliensis]AKU15566.1 hypothetical protein VV02_06340 [Luteipulveratus mongoliensis]